MPDYLPHFAPAAPFSRTTSADVLGGRLVAVGADAQVAHTVADDPAVLGVAGYDAAVGAPVLVYPRPGGVHRLTAASAISAGGKVVSAADGKVAPVGAGVNVIGIALGAAAAGAIVDIQFI